MIELTTSAVFLVASLYGSGQTASLMQTFPAGNQVKQATSAHSISKTDSVTRLASTTDTVAMKAYLTEQFGDKDAILVDIARCESNFHQFDKDGNIIRGVVNNLDIGVMQINERYQGDTAKKLGLDIYTVTGNVAYAKHLYEEQGAQPWSSSSKCWSGVAVK